MPSTIEQAGELLTAAAVRARCGTVFAAAERGETSHFQLVISRLGDAVRRVADITLQRYPDLEVPYHSRWRHFSAGGVDRTSQIAPEADKAELARAQIDLAVASVLLDAGAGPKWSFYEAETGQTFSRSEGLAVASLRAMQGGLFSTDPAKPWRADAEALSRVTPNRLALAFQHVAGNELAGIDRRAALLRRMGEVCASDPTLFGSPGRPGNLYDYWLARGDELTAPEILRVLLQAFAPIWPARISLRGVPLGDCGHHPAVPGTGLVPFHKLTQWLAYSLVEPLTTAGLPITNIDGLTGLAEYRNGGLFIDCGVIEPRDPRLVRTPLDAQSEPVVEWRALTVALLDRLAVAVRQRLGKTPDQFPLARVLEGGSWAAGRAIALERRPGGAPPLTIISDGTVF
ncbi:MAG: URC4/urg3 family protein [Alphaproteobacteria bacterium]|nr:URC4/urg3 family protein [Alphaproteobacteria bacterium]